MFRVLSLVVAIFLVGALSILAAGYLSNPKYSDTLVVPVNFSPDLVWAELVEIDSSAAKKADVKSVEVLERYGKLLAWQENLKNGGFRIYRMNERQEGRYLEIELTSSSYGLTGTWSFQLTRTSDGTELTIKEDSTLDDIRVRGTRYFMGREHDLLVWAKYIRVGLTERLLSTP